MVLSTLFRVKKRARSPKPPSHEEMEVQFRKWFDSVSIAEIRTLFLDNLLHGHEAISGLLKTGELEHFDRLTASLETTPEGHIKVSSVIHHLKQTHTSKSQVIESAGIFLESLVIAHAHFPFSNPVSLTRDTLLQAVILLTWRCDNYFRQRTAINQDVTIRTRPESARLLFIFSALAHPPKGISKRHDIVDVLCRLNYPMARLAKPRDEPMRRPVTEIEPLAERLQPEEGARAPKPIAVASLKPLVGLVAAFPTRWEEPVVEVGLGEVEEVSGEQFVRWAKRVRLLDVLHQVFEVFLRDP